MLTHHAIENAGRASHYFSAQDDYYSKEGRGIWLGLGARRLGLNGDVDPVRFRALLEGRLPDGRIIQRTFKASTSARRHGWDFTFSAPKSVSMQALIGGDQAVIKRAKPHINIQGVTAQPRIQSVAEQHQFAICRAVIDLRRLQVWTEKSISRIED